MLRTHLQAFLARADERGEPGLPSFVPRELYAYLDCGILANGFARVHCSSCGRDELVAFSCKGRGFCPSCGGRRMAESAMHLADEVLPAVPVRQWVLSFAYPVRLALAYDAPLSAAVRRIFVRTLLGWHAERAARAEVARGRSGAVVVAQRFGSALNLNLHFHALVLDGVYASPDPFTRPRFHPAEPLSCGVGVVPPNRLDRRGNGAPPREASPRPRRAPSRRRTALRWGVGSASGPWRSIRVRMEASGTSSPRSAAPRCPWPTKASAA